MKFTLSWLRDHLETDAQVDAIAEALTDLGLEVEGIENPAAALGAFRICRVIEAVQHPNADRLRVCRVATYPGGPGTAMEEVQVVCGAPNARTGLVGVFAPTGTHVPGTGVDLKPGNIRGVDSNGMLCSERELMLSDDHDGIIDLPEDAPLGARFVDYRGLNDPVVEIKVTPNRPDALGIHGIARDLAARGLGRLKAPVVPVIEGRFPSPIRVEIDPALKARGCPHFAGRLIRGVRNGPSPDWLQARLKAIGLRPISALVDITNFFTFAWNRPLHVFDADKVQGGVLRIHPAKGGEEFLALDGKTYTLAAGQMAISDDAGVESLAGIMGGEHSGCTEGTVNVFLESAWWDPITVAATGRALKINSDARYRFERGVDPAFTLPGLDMATQMILDLCGGEASMLAQDGAPIDTRRNYRLNPARVVSLVGMDIPEAEQRQTLTALGFKMTGNEAAPPSWRPDILGEADLVEEVARIASLSRLKGTPMRRSTPGVPRPILTPLQAREKAARRTLAALGYNECVTYSFIDAGAAALFGGGSEAVRVENPISSEMTHLRPDLLPGLLAAAARNQARGFMDLALFEVGPAFHGGEPGEQHLQATGLLVGAAAARDPHGSPPHGGRVRRQGRCRGSAGRPGGPRKGPDHPQGGRLVASRPVGHDRAGAGDAGQLWRNPPPRAGRDGCEGPRGGLYRAGRQRAAAQGQDAHPAGAGDPRPASGRARLCLRRRCKGRGADGGECRAGGRQGADRKRAGVRPVHRREGRGADGRGQASRSR
jgi:phenylalanyl-tRNA synthetase beta chain